MWAEGCRGIFGSALVFLSGVNGSWEWDLFAWHLFIWVFQYLFIFGLFEIGVGMRLPGGFRVFGRWFWGSVFGLVLCCSGACGVWAPGVVVLVGCGVCGDCGCLLQYSISLLSQIFLVQYYFTCGC